MKWKLPLRYGIPALVALWVGHGFVEDENWRTVLLVVAMGVALWTAFSLNIPPRKPGDEARLVCGAGYSG